MYTGSSKGRKIAGDQSNPWLPAWEEDTEVLRVSSLLDEVVDLSTHTERYTILYPLQLLLQPYQHPLCHLVEVGAGACLVDVGSVEDVSRANHSHVASRYVFSLLRTTLQVEGF